MLTVDEAKLHLRVDGDEENDYIAALVAAATAYVQGVLTPAPSADEPAPVPPLVDEPQRQVVRLLVGHWYANREAATAAALSPAPLAVDMLLALHRPVWSFV